jgi:hypothetical protein
MGDQVKRDKTLELITDNNENEVLQRTKDVT